MGHTCAFGEKIQKRMDELGTNANQLSIATGFRPASISNWLHGKRNPRPESVIALANALALDQDELLELAGLRPRAHSDIEPERAEIVQMVLQLPSDQLEIVRDYVTWRMTKSRSVPARPAVRRRLTQGADQARDEQ